MEHVKFHLPIQLSQVKHRMILMSSNTTRGASLIIYDPIMLKDECYQGDCEGSSHLLLREFENGNVDFRFITIGDNRKKITKKNQKIKKKKIIKKKKKKNHKEKKKKRDDFLSSNKIRKLLL